jgi:hypothetical protein
MPRFIVDKIESGLITLRVAGCNYVNTFSIAGGASAGLVPGARVRGTILAPAWKVDCVDLGGNYVEPLAGRPRRMQGAILAVNAAANELTVQVGYEVTVKLPDKYRATDYQVGQRIGWDNLEIPTFTLEPAAAPV